MTSGPRSTTSIELVSVEASVRQSTVRAAYVVNLTTPTFEGTIGGGETTLDEKHAELVARLFAVVRDIQSVINEDLGLVDAPPETPQHNEEEL